MSAGFRTSSACVDKTLPKQRHPEETEVAMADDWQDLALNHRRIPHGKSKKGGKSGGRHGAGVFYPNRAIASYPFKTGNHTLGNGHIPRFNGIRPIDDFRAEFVIHGFTECPGGTGTFKAAVFLAGSRKLLSDIVRDEEEKLSAEDDSDEKDQSEDEDEVGDEDEDEVGDEDEDEVGDEDGDEQDEEADDGDEAPKESELEASDRFYNDRFQAFTKNSFRQPKFWFQWQGEIIEPKIQTGADGSTTSGRAIRERDLGYIVFPTHECSNFRGTINCRALGWKDMEIVGGSDRIQGPTPPIFQWNDFAVEGDEGDDDELEHEHDGKGAKPHGD
ncbi:hypothetical protein LTR78_007186 [Recurvomyces mirabilis]|uniref:Uncharacterized protein n=1 Tax=Recurvomyces mirabilis TaxID=574656 RepID=A0AAE0WJF9_9PEZI|nr:hypothetical protein LTR78_007186 [Recurvomyces mirabilis]KAK5155571.1 hypothetical protein LTS14_005832 [Recurvomyces mirabilis]